MMWGDFMDDDGGTIQDVLQDVDLIYQQMRESVPQLEGFNPSKPFRILWKIQEL